MIDTAYFMGLIFISLRLIAFFIVTPAFFPPGIPKKFKVIFSLMMSFMLISAVDYSNVVDINNNFTLIIYCLNEILTGITLGFITSLCFSMIQMAGSLIDIQIGLSMLTMYDPNSKTTNTLISKVIHWVALIIFFIVDGHHIFIKALAESFQIVNLGKFILYKPSLELILTAFIKYFVIGIKLSIPIVLIIIITDLTLGLISRTVPQLNIMILGMPIKIMVGVTTFLIALPMLIKIIISAFGYIPDIFRGIFKAAPLFIIFASDEKTEDATPKKKSESKKKGQIARSKDVGLAFTLVACVLVIAAFGGTLANSLKDVLIYFLSNGFDKELTEATATKYIVTAVLKFVKTYLPVVLPIMVLGIAGSLIQTGFVLLGEPLKPSLSKLNPIKGFKNMFSKKSFVDLIKNFIVVCILSYVGYSFIKDNYYQIMQMGNLYLPTFGVEFKKLILKIFGKVAAIMVILAATDYFVQRRMHNKSMRMTKQEIKEEFKQMEGDPHIKGKRRQKQREMALGRMMQAVPDATVVVTNPTHISVALKYDQGQMEAPKLVAKGADHLALKIKELAKENEVPIIENKPLARIIYEKIDVDSEIPADMYQAVAEILAIVYKMKNEKK